MIKVNPEKALKIAKDKKLFDLKNSYSEKPIDSDYTDKKSGIEKAKTLQAVETIVI